MKNQYFGDIRDLFKYDLIQTIMQECPSVRHFSFIPMLTPDDDSSAGGKTRHDVAKAGKRNEELKAFLKDCVHENRRNIAAIADYFRSISIDIRIYRGRSDYFSHETRREYFKAIGTKLLTDSLIFLDPDNGLEVKRPAKEHVLYREVASIYSGMTSSSIVIIYQHFPRQDRNTYLRKRQDELCQLTGEFPICISDNQIVFFLLTKEDSVRNQLANTIDRYQGRYACLRTGNTKEGGSKERPDSHP